MSEFHDDSSAASDPIQLVLSDQKLRWLQPELFGWQGWLIEHPWGIREPLETIDRRKGQISEAEWKRTSQLAKAKISTPGYRVRDGRPLFRGKLL